jgi:hypothetical protein
MEVSMWSRRVCRPCQGWAYRQRGSPSTCVVGYDVSSFRDSPNTGKCGTQAAIIHSQRGRTDLNAICDYLAAIP